MYVSDDESLDLNPDENPDVSILAWDFAEAVVAVDIRVVDSQRLMLAGGGMDHRILFAVVAVSEEGLHFYCDRELMPAEDTIVCVRFSPDASLLAVGRMDAAVDVYDVEKLLTDRPLVECRIAHFHSEDGADGIPVGGMTDVEYLVWQSDSRIVCGCVEGVVVALDIKSLFGVCSTWTIGNEGGNTVGLYKVTGSEDILTCTDSGSVTRLSGDLASRVWKVSLGRSKEITCFASHTELSLCVACIRTGELIFITPQNGKLVQSGTNVDGVIYCAAFLQSADGIERVGTLLALGTQSGTIFILNCANYSMVSTFQVNETEESENKAVTNVRWHVTDQKILVIASYADGTVRVWNIHTELCLELRGHAYEIHALESCPTPEEFGAAEHFPLGCLALSGGEDRVMKLWRC